ncbi:MAG: zeta toxin family protein [Ahniella sp.]|nr:zeta toxin family protein [Ahniella sp.]
MRALPQAIERVLDVQSNAQKPLAVILAGHNGSGKSTLWYQKLANRLQIPLINADRMMMSVLPEAGAKETLPAWAVRLRDEDEGWMRVAQKGVQAFVSHAMGNSVPFAMETVFSHWQARADGTHESKIDLIRQMKDAGYFVLLIFVGLTDSALSIARVQTRIAMGGHAVPVSKLIERFPRTQAAIRQASLVADATLMVDNSRAISKAFSVCRVQLQSEVLYDRRMETRKIPSEIDTWLTIVSPTSDN